MLEEVLLYRTAKENVYDSTDYEDYVQVWLGALPLQARGSCMKVYQVLRGQRVY